MRSDTLLAVFACAALATAATAGAPADQASAPGGSAAAGQPGAPSVAADPNKLICRTDTETGSRLRSTKTCMTRAQWAERQRLDQDWTDHLSRISPAPGGH